MLPAAGLPHTLGVLWLYTPAFGLVALLPIIGTTIWWLLPVQSSDAC